MTWRNDGWTLGGGYQKGLREGRLRVEDVSYLYFFGLTCI